MEVMGEIIGRRQSVPPAVDDQRHVHLMQAHGGNRMHATLLSHSPWCQRPFLGREDHQIAHIRFMS